MKELKVFKDTNTAVGLYYSSDGILFTGFIKEADDEFVCMEVFARYGRFDGYHCLRDEEVLKMDFNAAYLNDLEAVYKSNKEEIPSIKLNARTVVDSLLQWLIDKKCLCTVEFGFEELHRASGYILSNDWNGIRMQVIDARGRDNGYTAFGIEDVVYIGVKSQFENYLEKLRSIRAQTNPEPPKRKREKEQKESSIDVNNVLSFPKGK